MFSRKAPLEASESLAARSRPTETIRSPSPPKAVPRTQFSWWLSRSRSSRPLSQITRTEWSAQPTAILRLSGESEAPKIVS